MNWRLHCIFFTKPRQPNASPRCHRLLLALALLPLLFAHAQAPIIPERYATTSQNTDFPGSDLTPLFDVTIERCYAACLRLEDCLAFTFNQTHGVCFPKFAIGNAIPFAGAISATISRQSSAALAVAAEAKANLTFLEAWDFETALNQALGMPERYFADGEDERALLEIARLRSGAEALVHTGAAVTVRDSGSAWLAHARALRDAAARDSARRFEYLEAAVSASVNASLRLREPHRAAALHELALALEGHWRGEAALAAMRYADRLQPGIANDTLQRLNERFGFRVLDHLLDTSSATPRICVRFSAGLDARLDYAPFVVRSSSGLALETEDQNLCISGVEYGQRYALTLRAGLPSHTGEPLLADVTIDAYVRDRAPLVRFPGRAFVLPARGPRAIPIETVNANTLELRLLRVSDRNLVSAIRAGQFTQALSSWEGAQFEALLSEPIWHGSADVAGDLNRATPSLLPLDAVGALEPGIYVLRANIPGANPYDSPPAMQWFLVSNLGLSSFSGQDGLHVVVQRLSDAQPVAGLRVSLVAQSNRVLGEATSDARGHVHFPAGLTLGSGAAAPILVLVEGEEDVAVLSLDEPEFDLSDRGVAGRLAPGAIDLYFTSDRGAYRPGETIHVTALARDPQAGAIRGLPLSLRLLRPDGVEAQRQLTSDERAGGHVFALPLGNDVPRGLWRIDIYADPTAPALGSQTVLVEDFLPERLAVDIALSESGAIDTRQPPLLHVQARLLFGPPAGGLPVSGNLVITPSHDLAGWPGYHFGRFDQRLDPQRLTLPAGLQTDPDGALSVPLPLANLQLEARPYTLTLHATVSDGASRPVERVLLAPLQASAPVVGIRPRFEGPLAQHSEAEFDLVRIDPSGTVAPGELHWQLDRVQTRYQWFTLYGSWNWEPVTERQRVADGVVVIADAPARIAVPLSWGRYELRVTHQGADFASASVPFTAGWVPSDARRDSPDLLPISLDADHYAVGDIAHLRIDPEADGVALVSVLNQRLVSFDVVEVRGVTTVALPVSAAWGAGAYVTVHLLRPSDGPEHLPSRSLGVAHARVVPGDRALAVTLALPAEIRSNEPLTVRLTLPAGTEGPSYATIAAIDVGILSLTRFPTPDPIGFLFGQQRLGVAIRDLYNRLIDARAGAMGQVRSGGGGDLDEGPAGGPLPAEALVSLFSGLLEFEQGTVELSLDLPPFAGSLRVMALVWNEQAVGQASGELLVRDPVVLQASLPRFLTPGDTSRLRVELTHTSGPAGSMTLNASGHGLGAYPTRVELATGGRAVIDIPLAPYARGDHPYTLELLTPDGSRVSRELHLSVIHSDPVVARSTRFTLQPGVVFRFDDETLAGFIPGTATATLVAGVGATLDVPGLLQRLLDYPYGCSEQIASSLQPLLYARETVRSLGLLSEAEIDERLQLGIQGILSRQSLSGAFGLWRASYAGGDLWLDAYLSETLLRAEAVGVAVPPVALRMALDHLRNELARAGTLHDGVEGYAYALWVLAQAGEAAIGDLRYYADTLPERFNTPLAAAQLAAALASYGEQGRSDVMFERAHQLALAPEREAGWRTDYGTPLRDRAALLALANDAQSSALDPRAAANAISQRGAAHTLSTQEAVWSLRAARSLSTTAQTLTLAGEPVRGDLLHLYTGMPASIGNAGENPVPVTLTVFGVPLTPPAAQGVGYAISRSYYTPEGGAADLSAVQVGDRLVVVLEVRPDRGVAGGRLLIDDALPAGFEIENPNLLQAGEVRALDWLSLQSFAAMTEARSERFLAAVDWTDSQSMRLAYVVRAVSAGSFHHPAALVEDMYRPNLRAVSDTGRVTIRP